MTIFWGFIGLSISTTLAAILNPTGGPLPFFHIVRVTGNVGGTLFITGLTIFLYRRLLDKEVRRTTDFTDMFFLGLMYFAGASGFAVEILSDLNLYSETVLAYFLHLLGAAVLLALAPFTKFVHAVGRTLILLTERIEEEATKVKHLK